MGCCDETFSVGIPSQEAGSVADKRSEPKSRRCKVVTRPEGVKNAARLGLNASVSEGPGSHAAGEISSFRGKISEAATEKCSERVVD